MTDVLTSIDLLKAFPDHTQLPESDGTFVKNFQEHPQSILLTDSLSVVLQQLHPDGQYCIGQDCGIYWRETEPPEKGAEAPDWFYVPHVPPKLDGQIRRSYVLWREYITPSIVLEFASGNGDEERDRTPLATTGNGTTYTQRPGKFWVYEQIARVPYYGIYEIVSGKLEVYYLAGGFYRQLEPNASARYSIEPLGVELGLWQGNYQNQAGLWLRWWDAQGNLLPTGQELAVQETLRANIAESRADNAEQRADNAENRADNAEQRANQLAERLRQLGIDPNQLNS